MSGADQFGLLALGMFLALAGLLFAVWWFERDDDRDP